VPGASVTRVVLRPARSRLFVPLFMGLVVVGCGSAGLSQDAPQRDSGSLSVESLADGDVVRKDRIKVRGSAPPGAEVIRDISFSPDDRTRANPGGRWTITVELDEGANELTFRIGDDDETAVTIDVTYEPRTGGAGSGSAGRDDEDNDEEEDERPFGKAPDGPTRTATVLSVTDGDTIRVLIGGKEERVRYIGMDAPELGAVLSYEATAANAELVAGQDVVLERDVSKRDQFGRLLRYVWLERDDGWVLVNRDLVRRGFAQAISYPPDVKYDDILQRAERNATRASRGVWGIAAPAPAPAPLTLIPQAPAGGCEPSYPDVCIPIGSADIDCGAIAARRFAVVWTVPVPDPHGFDADADGIGCESG
jgi:micrococcal nuclease